MTENHLTELELDRLARDSARLNESEKNHLDLCNSCKEKLKFLQQYYSTLEGEMVKPISERVETLSRKITRSNIIELSLYQPQIDLNKLTGTDNTIVLAAQHVAEETGRFVTVATFASEPSKTLVRIVKDRFEQQYRFHVLAENPLLSQLVLLGIVDESGRSFFLPTNKQGVSSFPSLEIIEWKRSGVTLHLPSAILTVEDDKEYITDGNFSLLLHPEPDTFKATITSTTNEHIRYALILFDDESTLVKEVHSHQIAIPLTANQTITEIRLFS
ncbi:MAG: hypothetical protein HY960_11925 [Ignavibacteriae bacterium]|nr:hypothetical protein [Ignavibacteriota bacterium]